MHRKRQDSFKVKQKFNKLFHILRIFQQSRHLQHKVTANKNRSQFPNNQKTISNFQKAEINKSKRQINISKRSLSVQNLCKSSQLQTIYEKHSCRNRITWESTQQNYKAFTQNRKSYYIQWRHQGVN